MLKRAFHKADLERRLQDQLEANEEAVHIMKHGKLHSSKLGSILAIVGLVVVLIVMIFVWILPSGTIKTSQNSSTQFPQPTTVGTQLVAPPVIIPAETQPVQTVEVTPTAFVVQSTPTTSQVSVEYIQVMSGGVLKVTEPDTYAKWSELTVDTPPTENGVKCKLIDDLIFVLPPGTTEATLVRLDRPGYAQVQILPASDGNFGVVVVKATCYLGDIFYFSAH